METHHTGRQFSSHLFSHKHALWFSQAFVSADSASTDSTNCGSKPFTKKYSQNSKKKNLNFCMPATIYIVKCE